MRGPESRLVKKIRLAIEARYPGSVVLKIHGNMFQNIGVPDLLICLKVKGRKRGIFVGIEVKVPSKKGRTTEAQKEMIRRIELALGIAGVAETVQEALAIIQDGLNA